MESLSRSTAKKEVELVILKLPQKEAQVNMALLVNASKHLKKTYLQKN